MAPMINPLRNRLLMASTIQLSSLAMMAIMTSANVSNRWNMIIAKVEDVCVTCLMITGDSLILVDFCFALVFEGDILILERCVFYEILLFKRNVLAAFY